jgi:hypothetical protein
MDINEIIQKNSKELKEKITLQKTLVKKYENVKKLLEWIEKNFRIEYRQHDLYNFAYVYMDETYEKLVPYEIAAFSELVAINLDRLCFNIDSEIKITFDDDFNINFTRDNASNDFEYDEGYIKKYLSSILVIMKNLANLKKELEIEVL